MDNIWIIKKSHYPLHIPNICNNNIFINQKVCIRWIWNFLKSSKMTIQETFQNSKNIKNSF
jgi:hypothetical protein